MKIAIHQPNYLPWIGFFDKLDSVDQFVILDKAHHSKSGFVHRNKIKTPQGEHFLTVPLKNKGKPINQLLIANETNWQQRHWKTIEASYKKSPFWKRYKDGFEAIYTKEWTHLCELNLALLLHLIDLLNITTTIIIESELPIEFGKNNERNVNLVSYLGGDIYLSGIGAKAYNDPHLFETNQIKLIYQQFQHPIYPQRFGAFLPNLSIIDLLFNCGPKTMEIIRKNRIGTF